MNIVFSELEISEKTGFAPDIDIFNRKSFGERLANLVENSGGNMVIALDAGWGQGKSTFIKMWRGYLLHHREQKIKSVYFDAFENDYQKDPFLALASEMYQLLPATDTEKKEQFKDKAIQAGKSLARGGLKLAVKNLTLGIVEGADIDEIGKDISTLLAGEVDNIVKDKFEHAQQDKLALRAFRKHLSELANEVGEDNPIVFIIDELDRCRPDFALELLEQVKHLFSVKGITFLLVTNREQLDKSIEVKYGAIDPVNYLHKFINVWLTMPRAATEHDDNGYQYLRYAIRTSLGEENNRSHLDETESLLYSIVQYYQPSFREIDRILSYFAILNNMTTGQRYDSQFQLVMAMVCYLKVCKPYALIPINGRISYEQIATAANFADIEKTEKFADLEHVVRLIKYDFSNEAVKQQMIDEKQIHQPMYIRTPKNHLILINKWLSDIKN